MRSFRMRGLAAVVPCVVVLVAGCAAVEAGSPIVGGSTPVPPATTTMFPSSDPSDAPGEDGVASVDPCALITEEELSLYGDYKEPSPDEVLGARACDFHRVHSIDNRVPTLKFVVQHDLSIEILQDRGFKVDSGRLDSGREFAREEEDERGRSCTMALAVGEQARVDIMVTGADKGAGCDVAAELAEIVDPRLPQG